MNKQAPDSEKAQTFKRTHPISSGGGGKMTDSTAGRTGRRWQEERGRPPSYYLLGKGQAVVQSRYMVVILGNVMPTEKWQKVSYTFASQVPCLLLML